jgi:hypothetical protein
MQTIKTMWKAIFQNKVTIYKANLPSFVQKITKRRCYSAEMPPENGGVRKAKPKARVKRRTFHGRTEC